MRSVTPNTQGKKKHADQILSLARTLKQCGRAGDSNPRQTRVNAISAMHVNARDDYEKDGPRPVLFRKPPATTSGLNYYLRSMAIPGACPRLELGELFSSMCCPVWSTNPPPQARSQPKSRSFDKSVSWYTAPYLFLNFRGLVESNFRAGAVGHRSVQAWWQGPRERRLGLYSLVSQ